MNTRCPKPIILAAIAAALFLLSASSTWAQGAGSPPPLMTERDRTLKHEMDMRTRGPDIFQRPQYSRWPVNTRALRMAKAIEIRKDAERMRFFNTEMMRSVSPGATLDYEGISKAAGEIKKRAKRLMLNLGLPRSKEAEKTAKEQDSLDARELPASLMKLDNLVKIISANPLLVNRNVIDAQQASNARQDLETIIALSDQIRKSARRLKEAARQ